MTQHFCHARTHLTGPLCGQVEKLCDNTAPDLVTEERALLLLPYQKDAVDSIDLL